MLITIVFGAVWLIVFSPMLILVGDRSFSLMSEMEKERREDEIEGIVSDDEKESIKYLY